MSEEECARRALCVATVFLVGGGREDRRSVRRGDCGGRGRKDRSNRFRHHCGLVPRQQRGMARTLRDRSKQPKQRPDGHPELPGSMPDLRFKIQCFFPTNPTINQLAVSSLGFVNVSFTKFNSQPTASLSRLKSDNIFKDKKFTPAFSLL